MRRHRPRLGPLLTVALATAFLPRPSSAQVTENVVLVTLDGARTEEIFGGLDLEILSAWVDGDVTRSGPYRRYWADSPEDRRERLMPFLWGTLLRAHGSIAGNPALDSHVRLANRHRFSYPGYSEILTGVARDDEIDSNAPRRNPYPTVLERLQDALQLDTMQVATFASWSVFNWIVEHVEGATTTNAGFEAYEHPSPEVQALSAMQFETPTPWNSVRHDVYTFRLAMAHLRTYRPRVLYLALGETDDWAHDDRYDRVLEALTRSDRYLEELWRFLQDDPQYAGRTTIVITTDHGRGTTPSTWRHHESTIDGAERVWLAVISPDVSRRGEWTAHEPIEASQVAATLARFVGVDLLAVDPEAAPPIAALFADTP